ncbi:hypothetical protein D9757_002386 [Collybiopsis confluens]|uniref:Store-operated calcium entry-associated regulatory factor n=1 Tax=Collybiopsis confluens TaxID=2823264 RepID=A0A8H5HXX3_9AGAR|nr:hypothetical protein D9757_002386 [Collybiopsis confluens]
MSRIKLSDIPSLTFYKGELTTARRSYPLPQLVCIGEPCRKYEPEAVHCKNIGGAADFRIQCEADLPEVFRFGKVGVSCEGWSRAEDPYVLKGDLTCSCSLQYRLVEIPDHMRNDPNHHGIPSSAMDLPTVIFTIVWVAVLLLICYSLVKSCFARRDGSSSGTAGNDRPGGGAPDGGRFPGNFDGHPSADPPPPYSKNAGPQNQNNEGWRPGFWSGALMGGLADRYLLRNPAPRQEYDWEHHRHPTFYGGVAGGGHHRPPSHSDNNRGEGSSNLGGMRRSTGFGSSNVR